MLTRSPAPTQLEQTHQRLAHANRSAVVDSVAQGETFGRKYYDSRAMLEPAEFLAFAYRSLAIDDAAPFVIPVQSRAEAAQTNAGDQNRRDRDQRHHLPAGREL